MAMDSKIAWTDHTFNPWRGCLKVAPECEHCYALDLSKRFGWRHGQWGTEAQGGTRILTADAEWRKVRKLNESSEQFIEQVGRRPLVFVASLADVFEDWSGSIQDVNGSRLMIERDGDYICSESRGGSFENMRPLRMYDLRARFFKLVDECSGIDFQLLTKRPENVMKFWPTISQPDGSAIIQGHRANVWIGTSAGTQATAEKALPELVKCRSLAPVLFVSAEPLLESVDFSEWLFDPCGHCADFSPDPETGAIECSQCDGCGVSSDPAFDIDWIIGGAESGPERREFKPDWIADLANQAEFGEAAFFCKQGSAMQPGQQGQIIDELWSIKNFPRGQHV